MFTPFSHEDHALESEIARVYSRLNDLQPDDEEYQKASSQLSRLYKLRTEQAQLHLQAQKEHAAHQLACDVNTWKEEQDQRPFYARISPDTALAVAGSLVTALIVVKYEQAGVISTKAMSFMRKF